MRNPVKRKFDPKGANYRFTTYESEARRADRAAVLSVGLCDNCGKDHSDFGLHICPFKEEIYEDYTNCNCCFDCGHNCLMEI